MWFDYYEAQFFKIKKIRFSHGYQFLPKKIHKKSKNKTKKDETKEQRKTNPKKQKKNRRTEEQKNKNNKK